MATPEPLDIFVRRTNRVFAWVTILGIVIAALLGAMDAGLFTQFLYGSVAALLAIVTLPAGLTLGLATRGLAAAGRVRAGAALAALAGLAVGWMAYRRVGASQALGLAVMVVSALALLVALRPPFPRALPALSLLVAGGVLWLFVWAIPKFDGLKDRDYYAGVRQAMNDLAGWETTVHMDSNHYSIPTEGGLLSLLLPRHVRFEVVLAADGGYRARTTSTMAPGAECLLFVGTTPTAPGLVPGVPACRAFPETRLTLLGAGWLATLGLAVLLGLLYAPARTAPPQGASA